VAAMNMDLEVATPLRPLDHVWVATMHVLNGHGTSFYLERPPRPLDL
jgi:hypothetical protein